MEDELYISSFGDFGVLFSHILHVMKKYKNDLLGMDASSHWVVPKYISNVFMASTQESLTVQTKIPNRLAG